FARGSVSTPAAGRLAAGWMGRNQSQSPTQSPAIDPRLRPPGNAAQRIVLFALLDDDVGNCQRPDVNGAVETYWRYVRLRQVRAVRRFHSTNADALRKSDTERIGAALFWLDLGSHRTL